MENKNTIAFENISEAEQNVIDNLDTKKLNFVNNEKDLHDQAFETKPVSYLHDCFNRFRKNKGSIVAGIIILIIILYAIIVPLVDPKAYVSAADFPDGYMDATFSYVTPYNEAFKGTGFWDGTKQANVSEDVYNIYLYDDSNYSKIVEVYDKTVTEEKVGSTVLTTTTYSIRQDTYAVGTKTLQLLPAEYEKLVNYEEEKGITHERNSILKPLIAVEDYLTEYEEYLDSEGVFGVANIIDQMRNYYNQNKNVFFKMSAYNPSTHKYSQNKFFPVLDENGQVEDIYLRDAEDKLVYSEQEIAGGEYEVRVDYFDYFTYRYGIVPHYLFGSNNRGQDIFLRLAIGTRFSLLLGVCISFINFVIGLLWGAISGYYGGKVDLVMERITDIISNVPSLIILTICSIQFTNNLTLKAALGNTGLMLLAILVAFVYNGWVGVASTTRMQFYRFKGQEYVLASRTLGAKDSRLIFKHILPNAIGTLVTSSVLMIPGVIFSESSLSYLGIINFSTSGISSIGTLLDEGNKAGLGTNPFVLLIPAVIISLLMICFNLFGNGLRDAFNTSLKGSED